MTDDSGDGMEGGQQSVVSGKWWKRLFANRLQRVGSKRAYRPSRRIYRPDAASER